ncbi:pyrimidine utilization protein A [Novosphingobium resinovorum]|uniref:pyrimidine utilization protein A n=1 Tax=Novosphingobium resinovorum TaxID=158500 RepID=UPI002ED496A2|nr:pyrimidine utilization protein A [Novosphingobium resinovorum]
MDIGLFIPIGNNGWLISENAPQYKPSFAMNKKLVQTAENYGFDFALSMIKLRGFGGKTEFWDYNLESFTLMSALAAVTSKIKLFASTAILTLPPAMVARMAVTIDSVAPGRFGVNIVTGWAKGEYEQMGVWPGDAYFGYRYDYAGEYVQVMKDLWNDGKSDLKGAHFQMEDCQMLPRPEGKIEIVGAGQSAKGMDFVSNYGDYNFITAGGINKPTQHRAQVETLVEAAAKTGRDVGAYILCMVIADETDEAAFAKWESYRAGADVDALAWMSDQGSADTTAGADSTARHINLPEGAVNLNIGTFVGSYETVARLLDEAAAIPGTKGIMLTFDDFQQGLEDFGEKVQPLMACRQDRLVAA